MEYKSLDFVALWSGLMGALAVLGAAARTVGPWAQPSAQTARMTLTLSWFAFWMIGTVARSVRTVLVTQADEIAALRRQLGEQRPAA